MMNLIKKVQFVFLLVCFSFGLPNFAFASDEENSTVIKIENAQKSEYKKNKETDEDLIVLEGQVKVSVTKGSKTTVIEADRVNYNRATEMLYAEGNVSLNQSSGKSSGGESVTANSLLFNTSTLEGVFDNGRAVQTSSDAINLPSGSTLIVASNIFGRDSDGTIAFKSGELTFCDDENPHWRIKASRIWLLPGGEFSFLNAVLYVGRIPLLWLPAFYYPKDELIFNPTFGYKYREGYFINTTTYLYGRKPKDAVSTSALGSSSSSSSDDDDKINFFSFMNTGAMKEQVREGLVLHNLNEDFTGDTTNYFKVLADYYSNLGTMFGYDTVLSPGSYMTSFKSNLKIGFSNTVFKKSSVYLPYDENGEIQADKSNFMSFTAPFRYQANLAFTIAKPFSMTVSLPVYSDPYFDYDFNNRAETMDWIDYAMSGTDTDDDDDSVTETSSFTWNVNGSYSFKLPDVINPWISSLAVSSFSSSVVYSSKANTKLSSDERYSSEWEAYTPERKFYYPSLVTPFKTTGKIAGTLIQIPAKSTSSSKSSSQSLTLNVPEELMTEEEIQKKREEEEKKKAEAEKKILMRQKMSLILKKKMRKKLKKMRM
ncbi:LPS-assembly protein LptD [Treponema zioleckii]|uniref:LPS-assembly protein LptD n=1 Tax=Treponema zioleckii TaxID=331680 RepID=UPI00168C0DC8|nr:LPS-assembly protein LptD [Treponema zioleckii]